MMIYLQGKVVVRSIEPESAAAMDGRIAVGDQLVMVGVTCSTAYYGANKC